MMDDRTCIIDPPDLSDRTTQDDAPEALGEEFELSVEDKAKIHRASQWGRSMILAARAGDPQALQDLQTKMHVTRLEVMR